MSITSNIQQNVSPSEPHLIDLLNLFKKDILLNFNAHHLGTIQSFDSSNQAANATINYKKTFFEYNADTANYQSVLVDYPVLSQCPVICLGGGKGSLTFPIQAGDECLILFNDRDLDNWFSGGSGSANSTARLHSFSDAIILVGVRSLANVLTNYDGSRVVLSNGTTLVGIGDSLIKIANQTYTLNGILQNLMTQLENLTTALSTLTVTGVLVGGANSGPPTNAATFTMINTNLTTIATHLGDLLE